MQPQQNGIRTDIRIGIRSDYPRTRHAETDGNVSVCLLRSWCRPNLQSFSLLILLAVNKLAITGTCKSITVARQNCVHRAETDLTYPLDFQIRS